TGDGKPVRNRRSPRYCDRDERGQRHRKGRRRARTTGSQETGPRSSLHASRGVTLSRLDLTYILVLVLACAKVARADETIVVHGDLVSSSEDARDRRHALGQAAFVTRIHVDAHAGEAATLTGVLGASAGLHVQSLGGLGAFASISVRGASSGQTTVLIDGVPL